MNKDICKYINNCAQCKREKARTQVYPLQTRDIPDRPFDKIAIELVSDLNMSASGNQCILTIINHLIGWPKAFPILDKKADLHVPSLHTVRQWHRFQKTADGQSSPTTWH